MLARSSLIAACASTGYVTLEPDPTDGRAKLVRLSGRSRTLARPPLMDPDRTSQADKMARNRKERSLADAWRRRQNAADTASAKFCHGRQRDAPR